MRKLLKDEVRLLELLIKKSSIIISYNLEEDLEAEIMNDGGMGSLKLFPKGISSDNRVFGKQIAECMFLDSDGIDVIASLNIDDKGELFELDIWKTDFSSLIRIPEIIS
ncbi:hypothetical protein EAH81_17520 [Flavobacterium pectinovorum]|uniref:DUF6984 domain-containing protein n=2 Tax=Flavobacterium pectinovorum TaxID=29533 RepID=A0A502EJL9_9FLAO|nr:hypothetical protein EAH81_17520 [Flavobacterium pectinovorum]